MVLFCSFALCFTQALKHESRPVGQSSCTRQVGTFGQQQHLLVHNIVQLLLMFRESVTY